MSRSCIHSHDTSLLCCRVVDLVFREIPPDKTAIKFIYIGYLKMMFQTIENVNEILESYKTGLIW